MGKIAPPRTVSSPGWRARGFPAIARGGARRRPPRGPAALAGRQRRRPGSLGLGGLAVTCLLVAACSSSRPAGSGTGGMTGTGGRTSAGSAGTLGMATGGLADMSSNRTGGVTPQDSGMTTGMVGGRRGYHSTGSGGQPVTAIGSGGQAGTAGGTAGAGSGGVGARDAGSSTIDGAGSGAVSFAKIPPQRGILFRRHQRRRSQPRWEAGHRRRPLLVRGSRLHLQGGVPTAACDPVRHQRATPTAT